MREQSKIVNARADKVSPQSSENPFWFKDRIHWHARILMPFAKYVYIVRSQWQTLYNIPIPVPDDFGGNRTFGDYANWLNQNNMEIMDHLLNRYWRNNDECMCKPTSTGLAFDANYIPAISKTCNTAINDIADLNFQAPWGVR